MVRSESIRLTLKSLKIIHVKIIIYCNSAIRHMKQKMQIVIVGAPDVGKSSILGKLERGDYVEKRYAPTLGIVAHILTF